MVQNEDSRVDKFLWSVRIFKTRSIALDACKKGRISVDGLEAKPSKIIRTGNILHVKKPPVEYSYKVLSIPKSRISAKLVADFIQDLTPENELIKLKLADDFFIKRDKGTGRPTKKERRTIDKLRDN